MLKKNGVYRVELTDLNNLGCGVGRVDDMVVFVRGGVDGDVVDAKIIKVTKNYCVAVIEAMIEPSPHRVKSECALSGKCGGCVFSNVSYAHELELKKNTVKQAFRRAGMPDVNVLDTVSVGGEYAYRNKAQYPVAETENGYDIGFYAAKTHRVVDCRDCLLQPKIFARIIDFIRDFFLSHGISAYDELSGNGVLRHVYLREATGTSQTMVCLVLNCDGFDFEDVFVSEITKKFPEVCSIYVNVNKANTNVVLGDEYRLLWGTETIEDVLCGLRLKMRPSAFYQVNRAACEVLYKTAKEKAGLKGDECLLDLYCGIGSIGLSMADSCKNVVGIEIVADAVACARENAAANGIENARFFCGDAGDAKAILEREYGILSPDTVILDPPRKGCDERLVGYMSELAPKKIVYISCNPETLARDAVRLRDIGYETGDVTPVNMFPKTAHVECVVLFSR